MARTWCINCQAERDHAYISCGGTCGGNCQHRCGSCNKETLASITPNQNDTGNSLIKQMVGEAQRLAQRTGQTGRYWSVKNSY